MTSISFTDVQHLSQNSVEFSLAQSQILAMMIWALLPAATPPLSNKATEVYQAINQVTDRLLHERKCLKKKLAQITWERKTEGIRPKFWKRPRADATFTHALAQTKLYVEAALHDRAIHVLTSVVPMTWHDDLRQDIRYRTLAYQTKWLNSIISYAKANLKSSVTFRRRSADDIASTSPPSLMRSMSFQDLKHVNQKSPLSLSERWAQLLSLDLNDILPLSDSTPSTAYLQFEVFLIETHFDKSEIGMNLRKFCCSALSNSLQTPLPPLHTTVNQICSYLVSEHGISPALNKLECYVRQMLHVRLAVAYYQEVAVTLDASCLRLKKCKPWMKQMAERDLAEAGHNQHVALTATRNAFERIPTFIPEAIVVAYMKAITLLHDEAGAALKVAPSSLAADSIMPLLMSVLSESTMPHVVLQAQAMECCSSHEGGETAYYVALLQAAIAAC